MVRQFLVIMLVLLAQGSSPPQLVTVVPTYQAALYLYQAPAGAQVHMVTCEVEASGWWFGSQPQTTVVLGANPSNGYVAPTIYRATAPSSGRLYLKATPAALQPGRVLVSVDGGVSWETMAGPECRNTIVFPMVKQEAAWRQ